MNILFHSKDDEADELNINFVKIDDDSIAKKYGLLDELPILVYFEKNLPTIYEGSLTDEGLFLRELFISDF